MSDIRTDRRPVRGPAAPVPPAPRPPSEVRQLRQPSPPSDGRSAATRSSYLDILRAAAILRVYLMHTLWLTWLPMLFPAIWVMFAVAGYLTAASLDRGPALRVVRSRLRRLLPPLWALGLVVVPVMLVHGWGSDPTEPLQPVTLLWWVVPLANPPASEWGIHFALALWYLRAYLWLVLLSPLLWWVFRRWPVATLLLPAVAVLSTTPLLELPVNPVGDVVWATTAYGTCWLIGFARYTGLLHRVPLAGYLAGTVAIAVAGLVWQLRAPAEDKLGPMIWGTAFVLALLRARPRLTWLDRVPWLAGAVAAVNARAVTIYVWHLPAAFAAANLLVLAGVSAVVTSQTGMILLNLLAATVLLVVVVLATGWVEDLAARRRPTLLPPTSSALPPASPARADGGSSAQAGGR